MKDFIKLGFALLAVTFIAGFVLNTAYEKTKPKIEEIQRSQEASARKEVLPEAVEFTPVKMQEDVKDSALIDSTVENRYWVGQNAEGEETGIVIKVFAYGYDPSPVTAMAGLKRDGTVIGLKIIAQTETPGLGARIQETVEVEGQPVVWFTRQFEGLKAGTIEVIKGKVSEGVNGISAITAATITSKAVTDAVNKGYLAVVRETMNREGE
ncbi:MAG TPA: RnfABCDGE type electron transport complex subunit G [Candidatus Mcinerneyibacteriales bacterium]|nr:RnfABCDGE type electron transport complex subunit G [Candidatus Mcinerneyibacteriales bacterium]